MELECAVAEQYVLNVSQTVEVVFHTLYYHHSLTVAIGGECHVLQSLGGDLHLGHLTNLGEQRVVGRSRLALYGYYLQLRVDICK